MATTLIGTAVGQYHSVKDTQSGINVESISFDAEPEFREDRLNVSGHVAGQAVGDTITTLTISGETIRSGGNLQGLLAGDFTAEATAATGLFLTSSDPPMDAPTQEFVAQSANITQTRGAFETASITYIARTQLAIT